MPDFQILTRGMPSRADEWFRALNVPDSELPALTEDDMRSARVRLMTDEQYARHLVLRAFTREREEQEGEVLGNTIAEILQELGGEFQLKSIGRRGLESGWCAQILYCPHGSVERIRSVSLPTEYFPDQPGRQVLNIFNPDEIRVYLLAELGLGQDQRMAS